MENQKSSHVGSDTDVLNRETLQKRQQELERPELPTKTQVPKEKMVTVTFNVTVPESTNQMDRSVFLAGTLHQLNPILLDWDPHGQQMKKADDKHWTITLTGPENAEIEYKYVLGNWNFVEKGGHCEEIANRRATLKLTPTELLTLNDVVPNWRHVGGCGD